MTNDYVLQIVKLTSAQQFDIAFKIAENIGCILTRDVTGDVAQSSQVTDALDEIEDSIRLRRSDDAPLYSEGHIRDVLERHLPIFRDALAAQPPAAPVEMIETGPVTVNEWEDARCSAASERPEVSIVPMALSDGRTDYFVQIKVGDRAVTPHVFREEYKSAYHVALYDWLLNGSGEEPDCVEFGPDDWPGRVMPALPQPAPVTEKPRPSDCPWPVDCMWRHVPTVLEIGLHLCSRFGCPHRTSAQGVPDGSKAGPNYPGPVR